MWGPPSRGRPTEFRSPAKPRAKSATRRAPSAKPSAPKPAAAPSKKSAAPKKPAAAKKPTKPKAAGEGVKQKRVATCAPPPGQRIKVLVDGLVVGPDEGSSAAGRRATTPSPAKQGSKANEASPAEPTLSEIRPGRPASEPNPEAEPAVFNGLAARAREAQEEWRSFQPWRPRVDESTESGLITSLQASLQHATEAKALAEARLAAAEESKAEALVRCSLLLSDSRGGPPSRHVPPTSPPAPLPLQEVRRGLQSVQEQAVAAERRANAAEHRAAQLQSSLRAAEQRAATVEYRASTLETQLEKEGERARRADERARGAERQAVQLEGGVRERERRAADADTQVAELQSELRVSGQRAAIAEQHLARLKAAAAEAAQSGEAAQASMDHAVRRSAGPRGASTEPTTPLHPAAPTPERTPALDRGGEQAGEQRRRSPHHSPPDSREFQGFQHQLQRERLRAKLHKEELRAARAELWHVNQLGEEHARREAAEQEKGRRGAHTLGAAAVDLETLSGAYSPAAARAQARARSRERGDGGEAEAEGGGGVEVRRSLAEELQRRLDREELRGRLQQEELRATRTALWARHTEADGGGAASGAAPEPMPEPATRAEARAEYERGRAEKEAELRLRLEAFRRTQGLPAAQPTPTHATTQPTPTQVWNSHSPRCGTAIHPSPTQPTPTQPTPGSRPPRRGEGPVSVLDREGGWREAHPLAKFVDSPALSARSGSRATRKPPPPPRLPRAAAPPSAAQWSPPQRERAREAAASTGAGTLTGSLESTIMTDLAALKHSGYRVVG